MPQGVIDPDVRRRAIGLVEVDVVGLQPARRVLNPA